MTVQHNHNIEDELRLGLFLQVQFHSCENGMQEYLVRKRRWLLVKDTFICNLYCVDSNGDFVERKRPTEALLWVVIMICIPYFGTILYLVFGSTVAIKFTSVIRKKKMKSQPRDVEIPPSVSQWIYSRKDNDH